jgi:glycosyltransferase involved in cell wall biosynthesis
MREFFRADKFKIDFTVLKPFLTRKVTYMIGQESLNWLPHPVKIDFSIVIPAFNEETRIGATLSEVLRCVDESAWNAEIIVVDDGSTDTTADIVKTISERRPIVHLLPNGANRGKGYSVRNGMLHASGNIILFTDADLSSPIGEANRLFDAIRGGADVAIGSRWLERGRQTVRQPLYRRFFGRCFNFVTRLIMRLPFADTQCGFKAFTRHAAQNIFQLQRIRRWGFDPEILFIALKRGYLVREVPVTWGHDERSRISYLRDGLQMLKELIFVRWNALTGVYAKPVVECVPGISGFK